MFGWLHFRQSLDYAQYLFSQSQNVLNASSVSISYFQVLKKIT